MNMRKFFSNDDEFDKKLSEQDRAEVSQKKTLES